VVCQQHEVRGTSPSIVLVTAEEFAPVTVQPASFRGQHRVVDRLLQQGVPEAVRIIAVDGPGGDQQALIDQSTQIRRRGSSVVAGHTHQDVVLDLATPDRSHADEVLRGVRQCVDP